MSLSVYVCVCPNPKVCALESSWKVTEISYVWCLVPINRSTLHVPSYLAGALQPSRSVHDLERFRTALYDSIVCQCWRNIRGAASGVYREG